MNSGILVFIVGGCAGWVAKSIYATYKRKKMIKSLVELVNTVGVKLDEKKENGDETIGNDVIDVAEDILKMVKDEIED